MLTTHTYACWTTPAQVARLGFGVPDIIVVTEERDYEEGPGSPYHLTELTTHTIEVSTADPDTADDALRTAGWRRTRDWTAEAGYYQAEIELQAQQP